MSIERQTHKHNVDLAIVGGGIHGVGIACEAASRGLSTVLVHDHELASSASCSPSRVVGADLKALENLQLTDCLANLEELALLQSKAPHLCRTTAVRIVDNDMLRSRRRVALGVAIYQRMQRGKRAPLHLPNLDVSTQQATGLSSSFNEYVIDFARLSIALSQMFQQMGGKIYSGYRVATSERHAKYWTLEAVGEAGHETRQIDARLLVNCAGCQASSLLSDTLSAQSRGHAISTMRGEVFVRDRHQLPLVDGDTSTRVLQSADTTFIYVHRFDSEHLCIGPIYCEGADSKNKDDTIVAALALWNAHTNTAFTQQDVAHTRWSYQACIDDPSMEDNSCMERSLLDLNNPGGTAPLLTLFGTNPCQYRRIAEQALDILKPFTGAKAAPHYRDASIPGGDVSDGSIANMTQQFSEHYPFINAIHLRRLTRAYGTNVKHVLEGVKEAADLGQHFGHGLYAKEVDYLRDQEWVDNATDILWRRGYLGLLFNETQTEVLTRYLES